MDADTEKQPDGGNQRRLEAVPGEHVGKFESRMKRQLVCFTLEHLLSCAPCMFVVYGARGSGGWD